MKYRWHIIVPNFFFLVFCLLIAWCIWGAWIDTTPPIEILSGRLVSFDKSNHTALIEWEAIKHRHCQGTRVGWLRDGVVVALPEVVLPPESFHQPLPNGSVIKWTVGIEVPSYLTDDFVYKAEWDFVCNPMQTFFPLRIASPFVTVSQR